MVRLTVPLGIGTKDVPKRLCVAAHAYADTFSHYGFSGIASDLNRVNPDSIDLKVKNRSVLNYILDKTKEFNDKYVKGGVGNAVQLGHGAVSTYPDRPYLVWRFKYEANDEDSGLRENPKTFLEACEKLHGMFCRFGDKNANLLIGGKRMAFAAIQDLVSSVLGTEGSMADRTAVWQAAAKGGALFGVQEEIPVYSKNFAKDVEIMREHSRESIAGTSAYAFLTAARFHRDYVLDTLLPKHGLYVVIRT